MPFALNGRRVTSSEDNVINANSPPATTTGVYARTGLPEDRGRLEAHFANDELGEILIAN